MAPNGPKARPRKPAAKKAAPSHDDILHDAVTAVVNTIRAGRSIGHPVAISALALRLQVAAEEYARVEAS